MNILILAAGYGTRLKEFGVSLPKGLIEINGKTILERLLTDISTLEYQQILLITNNRFVNLYKQYCIDNVCPRMEILTDNTIDPEKRLGGVGDILFALDAKNWWHEDLLVCPSDTPTQLLLADFITFCKKYATHKAATILKQLSKATIANRLGCAAIGSDNIITGFFEKPETPRSNIAAIPFYFYSQKTLAYILQHREELLNREGRRLDSPGELVKWLVERVQNVYGYVIEKEAVDIGTVEDVQKIKSFKL